MRTARNSSQAKHDVIVIGIGGMGSAAAYHLAREGRRVLMLEQFSVGHTRGSSHGGSRIFRHSHDSTVSASLIPPTYELWRQLEAESGEQLLKLTGSLDMAPPHNAYVRGCIATMAELGFPFRQLTAREVRTEYPQFRIPADWEAMYQEGAGILSATRCVQTMAAQAVRYGAELREQTRVRNVTPTAEGVTVQTTGPQGDETVYADRAVITAGPWAQQFLTWLVDFPIPLRVTHQQVAYFAVTEPQRFQPERCPIFILTEASHHFYGLPMWEKPGYIKAAKEFSDETDPDRPAVVDAEKLDELSTAVRAALEGVQPEPVAAETCLYTETANRDFVIDRHPQHPQLVIGAGLSGRGFKFMVGLGRLLADLTISEPGTYDSTFWRDTYRITRFA